MSGRKPRKRRLWKAVLALAVLGWLFLCPSYLTRRTVERSLMRALNRPACGLSCDRADFRFSYLDFLLNRRIERLRIRGLRLDAAPYVRGEAADLFTNRTAAVDLDVRRDHRFGEDKGRMVATVSGTVLGLPLTADFPCRLTFEGLFSLTGALDLTLTDAGGPGRPLHVKASLRASPMDWKVTAAADMSAALRLGGKDIAVEGLRIRAGASGLLSHADLAPISVRAASVEAAGLAFTNLYATVRATEKALMVNEAGAGFCGGDLRLYSLMLDPESLNAGFTLFLDGIDAGRVMACVSGFRGEATGRLHGKLPLSVRKGREVRFRDAFLYSVPGETGKIRVSDATAIVDNLLATGVSPEMCGNLSKALADLDYTVLRLNLVREADGGMALSVTLKGSATSGKVTVPVSFEVTFHGDLEQLVNFGLRTATQGKREASDER